ncbi:hypothetical protein [uncultured Polaribacter sp.]|uniref:hypothetical protein n=1 Tax=uncultured Polaribacter sp. TaxID=174711 RepID=UPI0030D8BA6F|tara:strand:- start:857 stop:1567 length:711 start_codon:yes stop_codon:yes gene_type:complete
MEKCILLTATIAPHNVPDLKRTDSAQRENDYIEAIKFYLQFNLPIIFCENSNTKSETILEILKSSKIKFEYLTFKSQLSIEGKGKGEAEILSYAFLNSTIIKTSTSIVKITGRYKVMNFLNQINNINNGFIYVNLTNNLNYSDSRFFILNNFFYDYYLSLNFNKINEKKGLFMEHALLTSTLNYIADFNKWSLLNQKTIYEGVYGTDNTKYYNSMLKLLLKKFLYKLKIYFFKSNL